MGEGIIIEAAEGETTMADHTRRTDHGQGTGDMSGPAAGAIGETEADEFAGDVIGASDQDTGVHHPAGSIPGASGGGTGTGDLAGGTGIGPGGTDDLAGNEGPGTTHGGR